jgi:hypothetical protein
MVWPLFAQFGERAAAALRRWRWLPYEPRQRTFRPQRFRRPHLLAALSLAKLYRSTARPAEAGAVLAPAFKGFSPTREMPEIAEAEALLGALAAGEPAVERVLEKFTPKS